VPASAYSRHEHLRALWPWLPLWLAVALLAIFSHGPMPLYSTRTLAVAWEMWNQHHWLVPHINGEPYSEKVPLLFWLIHLGWAVFGVGDGWPRVLEVIFGGAQLILLARLAQRLFPERPWVATAAPWLLLCLSYAFLFGQQIMYEVLLAVCVLAALNCLLPNARRNEPRWIWFALWLGAGLLTKGPVMLLHVTLPWLLGPLWSDWANQHRARWYGRGALALLLGLAILLAWALPAGFSGGDAYRQRLFFTQTAGRVIKGVQTAQPLQSHAQPVWWYVLWLPLLLFPISAWPRATVAVVSTLWARPWRAGMRAALGLAVLGALGLLVTGLLGQKLPLLNHLWVCLLLVPGWIALVRQPLEPGLRFLLCWPVAALIVFSLISGKQLYYLLPEFGGAVLLIAAAIADLRARRPDLAANGWLGTWPLGLGGILFAAVLFAMPSLVASGHLHGDWYGNAARYSRYFAVVFLLLGALLFIRGRGELRRLAVAGLIGTLAVNSLFTLGLWYRYDLQPASRLLGQLDAAGRAIGNLGGYEGQYHFAGRLTRPIQTLSRGASLEAFGQAHPDGVVVTYPRLPSRDDLRYALLVQPFRGDWMAIWPVASLMAMQHGHPPPDPQRPTQVYPADAWRTLSTPP
jgi:4-amino-4-deoxy-L-arabinose transferase-like glycosyltransferase